MHFVCCLLMTAAAGVARGDEPVVEVFLPMAPGPTVNVLLRAREVVEKIYAEIGVRVIWRSTTSHPSGCSKAPLRRSIVVAIAAKTPVGMSGSAFAYANPLCGRRALRAAADGPIAGDGQGEST